MSDEDHPLVAWAEGELGTEEATGENDGPRILDYLTLPGHPNPDVESGLNWCAAFILRGLFEIGRPFHETPEEFYECRSVARFVSVAKRRRLWKAKTYTEVEPGNVLVMKKPDHLAIVTGISPTGHLLTIEGNRTNGVRRGSISPLHGRILGYVRL